MLLTIRNQAFHSPPISKFNSLSTHIFKKGIYGQSFSLVYPHLSAHRKCMRAHGKNNLGLPSFFSAHNSLLALDGKNSLLVYGVCSSHNGIKVSYRQKPQHKLKSLRMIFRQTQIANPYSINNTSV